MGSDVLYSSKMHDYPDFSNYNPFYTPERGIPFSESEGFEAMPTPFPASRKSSHPQHHIRSRQSYGGFNHFSHRFQSKTTMRNSIDTVQTFSNMEPFAQGGEIELNFKEISQPPFLQCLKVGCPAMFRSVNEWGSHVRFCSQGSYSERTTWLQCPFVACGKLIASQPLQDHFTQCHLIYICVKDGCGLAFDQETAANNHQHMGASLHQPCHQPFLFLEQKNWSLNEMVHGRKVERNACIPYENSFVHSLPVVSEDLNYGLCMSRTNSSVSSIMQPTTPQNIAVLPNMPVQISDSPRNMALDTRSTGLLSPQKPISAQYNPEQPFMIQGYPVRPRRTSEPPVVTNLSFAEQKPYLNALLKICISAAHSFYTQHNLKFALDKKSIPIFLTKDKQIACLPYDLTLPQWTQHLRKACDTRHITDSMVYSLESFKGEIQPVDEVRHALMKEKIKSDRGLLALIEGARTFVKQLKDWERCEMVDGVYDEVESVIDVRKRRRRTLSREGSGCTTSSFGSDQTVRRFGWE